MRPHSLRPIAPRALTLPILLSAALGLSACGGSSSGSSSSSPRLPASELTSPAARYCTSKGGRIKAETGRSGRAEAICYLPDSRIVNINALYEVEVVHKL